MTTTQTISVPPEGAVHSPTVRFRGHLIALLSTTLVMFHLYTGAFGTFPDLIQRSLHVGGTLILAFCLYDMRRGNTRNTPFGVLDIVFILSIVTVIGHLILSYDRIMGFTYRMTQLDYVFAIITTLLVLEGCRRVIGWTIPLLGIASLTYALAGPNLPGSMAHGGLDPRFAAEVLYISTRGLFGMVTGISATVIAMFVIFGAVLLRTGGGQTFIDLAMIIGGRTTGGGAKVATIASAMFGSVSGSAAANVATTGAFTIPLMKSSAIALPLRELSRRSPLLADRSCLRSWGPAPLSWPNCSASRTPRLWPLPSSQPCSISSAAWPGFTSSPSDSAINQCPATSSPHQKRTYPAPRRADISFVGHPHHLVGARLFAGHGRLHRYRHSGSAVPARYS